MSQIRPFTNRDIPHLARIWTAQPAQRSLVQPMSASLLDHFIFSKLHFDRSMLLVAEQDGVPVGFTHGGFGPAEGRHEMDTSLGVIYQVMVEPATANPSLRTELLQAMEQTLRDRGAGVIYGGGIHPLSGFYQGIYGGSELPGVPASDPDAQRMFVEAGYQPMAEVVVLRCDLAEFRPPVDRQMRHWRRAARICVTEDRRNILWWKHQTQAAMETVDFVMLDTQDKLIAQLTLSDLEPLATMWGRRAAGILNLHVEESYRRQGAATFLVADLFRDLQRQGVAIAEAQTMADNEPALQLYNKLGFTEVDRGTVYRK